MRVRGAPLGVEVVMPIGPRAPYLVEETDRAIVLTLYGVRANTDVINFAPNDSMVRTVEWVQETFDRARVTVSLRAAPYGYLVQYENNAMVLRLRGRPQIDPSHPLRGLTLVSIQAIHPSARPDRRACGSRRPRCPSDSASSASSRSAAPPSS